LGDSLYFGGDRLMQREAWQKTQPNAEAIKTFKRRVKALLKGTGNREQATGQVLDRDLNPVQDHRPKGTGRIFPDGGSR
jgi:hypothetical protein